MYKLLNEKKRCAAAALFLTAALLLGGVSDYARRCANVRKDVLRLHITANSDSAEDQAVKLLVRDEILRVGADIFGGAATEAAAEKQIENALPQLARTAARVLVQQGVSYGVGAELTREFFDTRAYGDLTIPAGTYTAVRIRLGKGEGKNWWCVMFPPLCLPAAQRDPDDSVYAVFHGQNTQIVSPEKGYRVRFRIVEAVERILERIG